MRCALDVHEHSRQPDDAGAARSRGRMSSGPGPQSLRWRRRGPLGFVVFAKGPLALERCQHRAALREARAGIDLEHAQGGIGTGRGSGLPDGFAKPRSPGRGWILEQGSLVTGGGTETLDRQSQLVRRRRHQRQAGDERQTHPYWVGQGLPEHHRLTPRSAPLNQRSRQHHRTKRPPPPFPPRKQTVDQQSQRSFELDTGGRLWERERLTQELARRPGSQRAVTSTGQLVGEQSCRPEPVRQDGRLMCSQLSERPDAQALERLGQLGQERPGAQQRDWQGSQKGTGLPMVSSDDHRPANPRPRGRGHRGEA